MISCTISLWENCIHCNLSNAIKKCSIELNYNLKVFDRTRLQLDIHDFAIVFGCISRELWPYKIWKRLLFQNQRCVWGAPCGNLSFHDKFHGKLWRLLFPFKSKPQRVQSKFMVSSWTKIQRNSLLVYLWNT
jgi:hypothetical protein